MKPAEMSYWRFVRTAKQPELPIVLLEDVGAEIGLVFALFGVVMTSLTDNARWDALGSVAIGLLLMVIAVILAVRMKALLIGEAASSIDQEAVIEALTSSPRVIRMIHIRTLHLGPEELMVAAKVEFEREISMADLAVAVDDAERAIRARVPTVGLIYIEPDLYRDLPQ